MIKRITFGLMSLLFGSSTFAATASPQYCEPVACFSTTPIVAMNSELLKIAPQYAFYTSKSQGNGGGWAFANKNKASGSSGGSSNWFMSVPSKGPVNSRGTFVFYPGKSTFAAYDGMGNLVTSGRASGGMDFCADQGSGCRTPVGTFSVRSKGGSDCVSNKYPLGEGGAPMPYCMFFNGGYAIHGSDYVPSRPASHGCIRLEPSTALWLRDNFMQLGTVVKVHSYNH